tara:strand:- start:1343 stop:1921 length:579 start_codon:yes stop_codon:yes gene_type:complete
MYSSNGLYKVDKHLYLSNINTVYNYELMKKHNIKYAVDCTHNSYDNTQLYKLFNSSKSDKQRELDKLSQLLEAVKQGKPYKSSDKYRFSIIKYPSTDPHTIKDIEFIKKTIKGMLSRLDNYMKKGENVLIFCHKGRHRSVALCMLYQMYKYDINYITSYRIMKKIYSEIFSHVGFSTIKLLEYYSNNRELLR